MNTACLSIYQAIDTWKIQGKPHMLTPMPVRIALLVPRPSIGNRSNLSQDSMDHAMCNDSLDTWGAGPACAPAGEISLPGGEEHGVTDAMQYQVCSRAVELLRQQIEDLKASLKTITEQRADLRAHIQSLRREETMRLQRIQHDLHQESKVGFRCDMFGRG